MPTLVHGSLIEPPMLVTIELDLAIISLMALWRGRCRPGASNQRHLAIQPSHCKTPLPAQFPRDLVYPVNSQQ